MRKLIIMLLLGGMAMMPKILLACPLDGDDQDPDKWRSPANNSNVFIGYDGITGIANVYFVSAISDAEVLIYQNGVLVDNWAVNATAGMQLPIYLPAYGSGEFTIQVKSGVTLLATYYTII